MNLILFVCVYLCLFVFICVCLCLFWFIEIESRKGLKERFERNSMPWIKSDYL